MSALSGTLFLIYVVIFPGFLFLSIYSLVCEYVDRKLYARFQNRVGPPWYQPLADFIKLLAKEDVVPEKADKWAFSALPIFALAAVLTSILYIPIWYNSPLFSFEGDLIMVLYILSIPMIALFLAGWYSSNIIGQVGSMRALTQFFAYEVPFLLAMLTPAILVGSWSISDIVNLQSGNVWLIVFAPLGFIIAIISLIGKLERIPFDIPEAETEIVAGPCVEYSGRRLALFRLTMNVEMVVGAALISALFLGGFDVFVSVANLHPFYQILIGTGAFIVKTLLIVAVLASLKALFARVRLDQMVRFCFRWMVPLAILQLFIVAGVKLVGWL